MERWRATRGMGTCEGIAAAFLCSDIAVSLQHAASSQNLVDNSSQGHGEKLLYAFFRRNSFT